MEADEMTLSEKAAELVEEIAVGCLEGAFIAEGEAGFDCVPVAKVETLKRRDFTLWNRAETIRVRLEVVVPKAEHLRERQAVQDNLEQELGEGVLCEGQRCFVFFPWASEGIEWQTGDDGGTWEGALELDLVATQTRD